MIHCNLEVVIGHQGLLVTLVCPIPSGQDLTIWVYDPSLGWVLSARTRLQNKRFHLYLSQGKGKVDRVEREMKNWSCRDRVGRVGDSPFPFSLFPFPFSQSKLKRLISVRQGVLYPSKLCEDADFVNLYGGTGKENIRKTRWGSRW